MIRQVRQEVIQVKKESVEAVNTNCCSLRDFVKEKTCDFQEKANNKIKQLEEALEEANSRIKQFEATETKFKDVKQLFIQMFFPYSIQGSMYNLIIPAFLVSIPAIDTCQFMYKFVIKSLWLFLLNPCVTRTFLYFSPFLSYLHLFFHTKTQDSSRIYTYFCPLKSLILIKQYFHFYVTTCAV